MREWSAVMIERMKELKPLVACFNGKGIYEIFNGGKCTVGVQPNPLPGTETVRQLILHVTCSPCNIPCYSIIWIIWPCHNLLLTLYKPLPILSN